MTRASLLFALLLAALLFLAPAPARAQDQDQPPADAPATDQAPDNGPPPLLDIPPKDSTLYPPGEFDPEALMPRLCHKVLAQVTCKPEGEFNFLKEVNGVFLFNAFYGSTSRDFYCQVVPRERIIISSTAWGSSRFTVSLAVDDNNRCAEAHIGLSMCDRSSTVRVCE